MRGRLSGAVRACCGVWWGEGCTGRGGVGRGVAGWGEAMALGGARGRVGCVRWACCHKVKNTLQTSDSASVAAVSKHLPDT